MKKLLGNESFYKCLDSLRINLFKYFSHSTMLINWDSLALIEIRLFSILFQQKLYLKAQMTVKIPFFSRFHLFKRRETIEKRWGKKIKNIFNKSCQKVEKYGKLRITEFVKYGEWAAYQNSQTHPTAPISNFPRKKSFLTAHRNSQKIALNIANFNLNEKIIKFLFVFVQHAWGKY